MSGPGPDYLAANIASWQARADDQRDLARREWALEEPTWGVFGVPDSVAGVMPDVAGRDVVEIGCGTAYVSAWAARRGGRPVAIDPTPTQLDIAAGAQRDFGPSFPLLRAAGEHLPFADESFDVAISEYGAAIWADPYMWIPEAARVLRPGGELVFLGNSTLLMLCVPELEEDGPATDRLLRPQRGMHRFVWPDDDEVEFHLSHGDWIRLLRHSGFEVLDLIELYAQDGSPTSYPFVTADWARRWPHEEVWRARRTR